MDYALPTSIAKRPCSLSSSSSSTQNPSIGSSDDQNDVHQPLLSLLSMTESPSFPLSLDVALDRLLVSGDDADHDRLIDIGLTLGKLLLESAKRCYRKRAAAINPLSWPLPSDLTIKVFSMLDTESLIYAASTCSMFHKFAKDPFCYSHIDLTNAPIDDAILSTIIQRAGGALRSLRLGLRKRYLEWNEERNRRGKGYNRLTRSCLNQLWAGYGGAGKLLRRLHIYYISSLDGASLCTTLSSCPYLTDLGIVDFCVPLKQILKSVTTNCHSIECLFLQPLDRDASLKLSTCVDLVTNCPSLTSLTLRRVALHDTKARTLVKGFRKLKYLDLSKSYLITGCFLRNLGNKCRASLLETLVLRDCSDLKEVEVAGFLASILAGDFEFIRHIDISNQYGLASGCDRSYQPNFPLEKLKEERPGIRILAKYPTISSLEYEQELGLGYSSNSLSSSSSSSSSSESESEATQESSDLVYLSSEMGE